MVKNCETLIGTFARIIGCDLIATTIQLNSFYIYEPMELYCIQMVEKILSILLYFTFKIPRKTSIEPEHCVFL